MTDTLPKLLVHNARQFGDKVALREKEFGIWQTTTWRELLDRVRNFSLGLISLGLRPDDKIAIIGDNRPEWIIAELAAQSAGAISMGVYQTSIASEVQYLVDFSDATFVVAEDQEQVDKVLEVWDQLPKVKYVIYYDPRGMRHYTQPFLLDFREVEEKGIAYGREHPGLFERNVEKTRPNDIAIFSTTSGTTGKPKLAMLTHSNLITMGRNLNQVDPLTPDDEYLSFLPLAWIGEQMMTIAVGFTVGLTINFPEEPETVRENLREIGPHVMFSPPRIWESIVSEVQVKIEDTTRLKRAFYEWAMRVGYRMADTIFEKREPSAALRWQYRLADWTVFMPIKDKFGLRRLKRAYTGGAALGPDVFRFFHAMGVNLKQIYGQTEITGIAILHRDGDIKFQTVGLPLPETELRIDSETGEILMRSPAVFQGYYKNPEATAKTLEGGWLHSGDAGYLDEDGHLIVIDRAKDVMTLADGTKFSPQFIENKLKFSPYIKEAVVFGGGDYPFVTAFINIDYENVGTWAERRQLAYTTYTDLAQKPEVYELIRRHVERTNQDLPPAARIQRFLLLHKELDADDEELTRTRKVRRNVIAERYAPLIAALYSGQPDVEVDTTITYQDGTTARIQTRLRIEDLTGERENAVA
ncbi:long-chain acyl-CoA synthetase [Ardenticatena maritima]|uniref:Acyl-CoA synthetase n=1 Tax=Ardenticatena maritima TaxID=872965 RepID=A0A0M8KA29_9CHLR|nr:long-chain fatty acid--CoA ligase [Ardenticatena maritima]KPL89093.1 long-chain fatty acid--CoA ligase [Ardenticatena maritima]GAP63822.1 long-chain acyl-CoA synthetase [Ardenticatena maritima]